MALPSIKDVGSGASPVFKPGIIEARVSKIYLEQDKYRPEAYYLMLKLDGRDLGDEFNGVYNDPEDPSKGRMHHQTANVRVNLYSFTDRTVKGRLLTRDKAILTALRSLAVELGLYEEVAALPVPETVEEYVNAISHLISTRNVYMFWCVGGKEYLSKTGNTNYTLFIGRPDYKVNKSYSKTKSEVVPFKTEHIIKRDEKTSHTVPEFGEFHTGDFTID